MTVLLAPKRNKCSVKITHYCYHCYSGSPEAPTNITVKRASLDTVVVSWVPGFNGGADCKFTVQFKESGTSAWTSAAVKINATSTELINNEGWDGLFVFRVTAVNQFGSSEYSEKAVELKGV